MTTKTWRHLQFVFALTYSVFLISGAYPYRWVPENWQPGFTEFYNFQFLRFRIVPGMGVFNFSENLFQFQAVGGCVKVDVHTLDGKIETSDDYPCPRQKPSYTFYQIPTRNFFFNLTNFGVYRGDKKPELNPYARAIAEYYCRKFHGERAVVQFTIYFQDLFNRAIMSQPSPSMPLDCAVLRSSS